MLSLGTLSGRCLHLQASDSNELMREQHLLAVNAIQQ